MSDPSKSLSSQLNNQRLLEKVDKIKIQGDVSMRESTYKVIGAAALLWGINRQLCTVPASLVNDVRERETSKMARES